MLCFQGKINQRRDKFQEFRFEGNKERCCYLARLGLAPLHICEGGIFHWQCPRGANISCKPWRGSSITMAIVCLSSDGKLRTFCEFLSWQTYRRQSDPSAFGSSFLIDMPTVFSSLLPSQDRGSDRWRPHTGFYTCTHSPIGGLTVAGGG